MWPIWIGPKYLHCVGWVTLCSKIYQIFEGFFLENLRHQKVILKLTDLYLLCCLGAVTHCAQENGSMWISARTSWGHHWSIFYHHLLPYPQIPSSMAFLLSYYYHEIYISNASLRTQAKFYKGQKISEPNCLVLISANKWTK